MAHKPIEHTLHRLIYFPIPPSHISLAISLSERHWERRMVSCSLYCYASAHNVIIEWRVLSFF